MDELPYILACDVGNSAIRLAGVCADDVTASRTMQIGRLGSLGDALGQIWRPMPAPKKLVAASVNPAGLNALETAADAAIGEPVLLIGRDLPLPMLTDLSDPASVGVDRLCCAVAAFDRLGVPCVVADFGTAVTIDCVNDEGVFLGGAIMPGLGMAARSLADGTAQLPAVKLTEPDWVFGKDTGQAIVGGVIHGARGALRELTEAYATALGRWPLVILTGGDAELVCGRPEASDLVQAVVPDLALRGVAIAYYKTLIS